jgi:uncharacterized protein with PQ loop repeat
MSINQHPHKLASKKKRPAQMIDRLVYVAVIGGPLMTLPQIYSIWMEHQKGVSIVSWTGYMLTGVIWLVYGLKHREWPIIILQLTWIALDLGVIVGLVLLK